jgi:hypothetical protein
VIILDTHTRYLLLDAYLKKIKFNYPKDSIYENNHNKYVKELLDEGYMEIIDNETIVTEKGKFFLDRRNGIR